MDVVAAIDIGTTYSGYAFSSKREFEVDMMNVHLNEQWMSGHANLHTYKAPSVVLLTPEKTMHSLGYEAERKFVQLRESKLHGQWYYFYRFKSELKIKPFRKDTCIEEEGGKSMNAITLYSLVLKYFKSHILDTLGVGDRYASSESLARGYTVRYVITVPTKWDNSARECMKSAAKKAGVGPYTIVTESEAAGRYCRLIPLQATSHNPFYIQKPGTRHVIVNVAGASIDTTVQEVGEDWTTKEIYKNIGNSSGGHRVDVDFIKFINNLFGNDFMEAYAKKFKMDYLEVMYEFELKKRLFSLDTEESTEFKLPASLIKAYTTKYKQSIQFLIDDGDFVGKILSRDDSLLINKSVMKDIFGPAVKCVVGYLTNLSRDPEVKESDAIILVGGFCDSPVVAGAVRFYFPNTDIMIVKEAELAVLVGGVLLGHNPGNLISIRAHASFGIGMAMPFQTQDHPTDKLFVSGNKQYCSDVFQSHIKLGTEVTNGNVFPVHYLSPNRSRQKVISVPVYMSSMRQPQFTTDDGCVCLGKVSIKLPAANGENARVRLQMALLGNSLLVDAVDEASGARTSSSFIVSLSRPNSY